VRRGQPCFQKIPKGDSPPGIFSKRGQSPGKIFQRPWSSGKPPGKISRRAVAYVAEPYPKGDSKRGPNCVTAITLLQNHTQKGTEGCLSCCRIISKRRRRAVSPVAEPYPKGDGGLSLLSPNHIQKETEGCLPCRRIIPKRGQSPSPFTALSLYTLPPASVPPLITTTGLLE
jgi:hypothetical protein